jgi:hypothetical protein
MFLWSKAQPVNRADNFTAICEQIVWTMQDPQHLTTLQASTACYGDSLSTLHIERQRFKHTISNRSHKNICEDSQKSDCTQQQPTNKRPVQST